MVPRMVQVNFEWALTGEPTAHKIRARLSTKVSKLLYDLCTSMGRDIDATRLVFNDKCLSNKDTLAKSGLQGQVSIGVVQIDPWEDVSSLLTKAQDIARSHPNYTFAPSQDAVNNIKPGDGVKIVIECDPPQDGVSGERFWTTVVTAESGFVKATVANVLTTINWPVGKKVQFTVDRIYDIETLV